MALLAILTISVVLVDLHPVAAKTKAIHTTDVGPTLKPAQPEAAALHPATKKQRQPKLQVRTLLEIAYTTNLFHLSANRTGQFDTKSNPGERLAGMQGPADVFLQPQVHASLRWSVSKKRDLDLGMGAAYSHHLYNGIADYFDLELELGYELTGYDRVGLDVDFIPKRFKKNYASGLVAGQKLFEPAYYRQVELGVEYERKWLKGLYSKLEYALELCNYAAPFQNRDHDTHNVLLSSRYLFHQQAGISVGVGFARAIAPAGTEIDPTLVVDRSFSDGLVVTQLSLALPRRVDVEIELEYRIRHFTTSIAADNAHYQRADHRIAVSGGVEKRFKVGLMLSASAAWLLNESDRVDPLVDPDDVGYGETVLRVMAGWRF